MTSFDPLISQEVLTYVNIPYLSEDIIKIRHLCLFNIVLTFKSGLSLGAQFTLMALYLFKICSYCQFCSISMTISFPHQPNVPCGQVYESSQKM